MSLKKGHEYWKRVDTGCWILDGLTGHDIHIQQPGQFQIGLQTMLHK